MNKQKIKQKLKSVLHIKRLWFIILIPLSLIITEIAKNNPSFAEFYAENIYRYISLLFNNISGILPFSLAEITVILLVLGAVVYIVYLIVMLIKKKGHRLKVIGNFVLNIICVVCVTAFLFTANCGINYYRMTFSELSNIEVRKSSEDTLYNLCVILAQNATKAREKVQENSGIMCLNQAEISTAETAKNAMNNLSETYPYITSGYSVPKGVMLSRCMSYANITGVFFPFTFEANVNTDIPDYSIPSTMCHELTHLRGFMREDEANFVSFLACIKSNSADFQYSGYMLGYIYASNALYSENRDKCNSLSEYISDGVLRDLNNNSEYWRQFETPVAQVASNINDSYLKSNSQIDGIKSYGRMVDLLIAYYNLQ
ncbi:MAG: DUF3810 domain-containing protein [Clostridia bacterium]|nr:DUF3810 domain-containing protein [Clostridia bacterium]